MVIDHKKNESGWENFLALVSQTPPIDFEAVQKIVKINPSQFPADNIIQDYYEQVFSKVTIAANRKKWHQQDKNLLVWTVVKFLQSQQRTDLQPTSSDFEFISHLLNVPSQLIVLKWISLLHTNLKLQPWSPDEDTLLRQIAEEKYKNNNWTELTIEFNSRGLTQRYPKQIRERWNNVLNPSIQKCGWTKQEKLKLLSLVDEHGKRWSKIQNYLQGRCENQIKNQYNGMMRNLKRLNLNNEQEKQVLQLITKNPDQKISLTINQFIASLTFKVESKSANTKLEKQISTSPTLDKAEHEPPISKHVGNKSAPSNAPLLQNPVYQLNQFSPINPYYPQYQLPCQILNNYNPYPCFPCPPQQFPQQYFYPQFQYY